MKPRFERLRLRRDNIGIQDQLAFVAQADHWTDYAKRDLVDTKLYEQALFRSVAAVCFFLDDNAERAAAIEREALLKADAYFFGEWRQTFRSEKTLDDAAYWKRCGAWMRLFENCLFLGAVLGEWEALRRLSSYYDRDCGLDPTFKEGDRALLLATAVYVGTGRMNTEAHEHSRAAISGGSKRVALLAELLVAIAAGDRLRVQTSFLSYLKYYKRSEFPGKQLTKKLCLMGGFFFELARHAGLKVDIPSKFNDYMITSEVARKLY